MRRSASSAISFAVLVVASALSGCSHTPGRDSALDPVMAVAVSPDGRTIAASTDTSEVALFDVAPLRFRLLLTSEKTKIRLADPGGLFKSPPVAFSPNSELVTAAVGGEIVGWSVASGAVRFRTAAEPQMVDVVFFPDGRSFLTVGHALKRRSAEDGSQLGEYEPPYAATVTSVAVSPDGRAVLAGLSSGEIVEFDPPSGKVLRTLEAHLVPVTGIAISPDGSTFASNAGRFDPRLWEWGADKPLPRGPSEMEGVGESIGKAVSDTQALMMFGWLLGTAAGFHAIGAPAPIAGAPPITTPGLDAARRVSSPFCGPRVAFSPDGRYVAASAHLALMSGEFQIVLADLKRKQGRVLYGIFFGCTVAFTPDSKFVITGGAGAPSVWNAETGERVDGAN